MSDDPDWSHEQAARTWDARTFAGPPEPEQTYSDPDPECTSCGHLASSHSGAGGCRLPLCECDELVVEEPV